MPAAAGERPSVFSRSRRMTAAATLRRGERCRLLPEPPPLSGDCWRSSRRARPSDRRTSDRARVLCTGVCGDAEPVGDGSVRSASTRPTAARPPPWEMPARCAMSRADVGADCATSSLRAMRRKRGWSAGDAPPGVARRSGVASQSRGDSTLRDDRNCMWDTCACDGEATVDEGGACLARVMASRTCAARSGWALATPARAAAAMSTGWTAALA